MSYVIEMSNRFIAVKEDKSHQKLKQIDNYRPMKSMKSFFFVKVSNFESMKYFNSIVKFTDISDMLKIIKKITIID